MNRGYAKSGLFLMELIIAIGFFAFFSAVCVQLFAKSHTISKQSADENAAVSLAQSAAEAFKATDASVDEMARLLSMEMEEGAVYSHYDSQWNLAPREGACYRLAVWVDTGKSPAAAEIAVEDLREGRVLYTLRCEKYIAAAGEVG